MSSTNPLVAKFLKFLGEAKSSYHAVDWVKGELDNHGYKMIEEIDDGQQLPERGYLIRDGGCILAYSMGRKFAGAGRSASVAIVASHSDSPCLKLRHNSERSSEGCAQLAAETYGGGLWRTWFDRGLGVAGKVICVGGVKPSGQKNTLEEYLVKIDRPIAFIPSLCIHMQTGEEVSKFSFNPEDQLVPIMGTIKTDGTSEKKDQDANKGEKPLMKMYSQLAEVLAQQLNRKAEDILATELCLYDCMPPQVGGINNEFIDSQGLDNKSSMYCNFESFLQSDLPENSAHIFLAYDHEEVGSDTTAGAGSTVLLNFMKRLGKIAFPKGDPESIFRRSLLVSCDAAHAVHPNYASKHQNQNKPTMGHGMVIKMNVNQRYATTAKTVAWMQHLAKKYEIPVQVFSSRNDVRCGSTIGPISATRTGIETIDCGLSLWAMHSIREMCHVDDVTHLVNLITKAYEEIPTFFE